MYVTTNNTVTIHSVRDTHSAGRRPSDQPCASTARDAVTNLLNESAAADPNQQVAQPCRQRAPAA
jgi:hypothetical protein